MKLTVIEYIYFTNYNITYFFYNIFNLIDVYTYKGFLLSNCRAFYQFPFNIALFFSLKFLLVINLLILIRGGTPRYRYDYLTKLGWLKFLGFVLIVFFFALFFYFLF